MALAQIEPLLDFHGPNPDNNGKVEWRRADPEAGYFPIENSTDDKRCLRFTTAGKTIVIKTVVNGKETVFNPQQMLADIQTPIQRRADGGWYNFYVFEVTG